MLYFLMSIDDFLLSRLARRSARHARKLRCLMSIFFAVDIFTLADFSAAVRITTHHGYAITETAGSGRNKAMGITTRYTLISLSFTTLLRCQRQPRFDTPRCFSFLIDY